MKVLAAQKLGRGQTTNQLAKTQGKVLDYIAEGRTIRDAMSMVDRAPATFSQWMERYPEFKYSVQRIRAKGAGTDAPVAPGDFGEWREKYLFMKTYPHMWQWVDVLEGRDPRALTDDQTYERGRPQRVMINTPPFHAKSTTITMDYVTYRICCDPNVRVIIISENRTMAEKFLSGIKDRLTHPRFEQMHRDFGPAGGFKVGAAKWSATMIYVGNRDSGEKDPTVEVLGVGAQIQGARAELIIMDDCVTLRNARTEAQRDKIVHYIDQDVSSRLGPDGKLLLVGTRVAPNDLYRHMHMRRAGVWTYLGQPAVQEFGESPDDWVTLWPEMWDGDALSLRKDEIATSTWNLVYMQQQYSEDACFPEEAVKGCLYLGNVGPLALDGDIRRQGMHGLYVVAGLDPATVAGFSAIVVLAVDKQTKIRFVLDVINQKMTPGQMREHIFAVTKRYKPNEWRIEKNGLNAMVTQDNAIRQFVHEQGSRIYEHQTTGHNKWDPDYGVASLASLFLGALDIPPRALIAIPNNNTHRGINALVDQLVTWAPESGGKTDVVMALWFAELGCRKILESGNINPHVKNRWLTDGQRSRQTVINIDDYLALRDVV